MSPTDIGLLGIGLLIVLLLFGLHIALCMILVGFLGFLWIVSITPALDNLALVPFATVNSYDFAVIPLFLLMSTFIYHGGIGREAFETARAWVGRIRGGLAMATVGACGLFAATSGSSIACAVAMGKVAFPEMQRQNYSDELASGCIIAGASLGILIPPSIQMVIVGILTEVSIGKLFMAGIIPGLLEIVFYMLTIYLMCRIKPNLAPVVPGVSFKEKIASLRLTWPVFFLFILVMGGIYLGVFTPTEAGAIGAFGAFVIGLARRKLPWQNLKEALIEAVGTSGMLLLLIVGSFSFIAFLAVSRIPFVASDFVVSLNVPKYAILAVILIIYLILGTFFSITSIIVLTIPIVFPTILALDFDPIWFSILLVRVSEVGFITPPFGLNLFGFMGVVRIPVETIYRGVIPFVIADILHITLLVIFPSLCLFIPNLM